MPKVALFMTCRTRVRKRRVLTKISTDLASATPCELGRVMSDVRQRAINLRQKFGPRVHIVLRKANVR